jgi:hypothetical protein
MQSYQINYQTGGKSSKIIDNEHISSIRELSNKNISDTDIWSGLFTFDNNFFENVDINYNQKDYEIRLEKGIFFHTSRNDQLENYHLKKLMAVVMVKYINVKLILITPNYCYLYYLDLNKMGSINDKFVKETEKDIQIRRDIAELKKANEKILNDYDKTDFNIIKQNLEKITNLEKKLDTIDIEEKNMELSFDRNLFIIKVFDKDDNINI